MVLKRNNLRQNLIQRLYKTNGDLGRINRIKGIYQIEKREPKPDYKLPYDCIVYAFGGMDKVPFDFVTGEKDIPKGYLPIKDPKKGDLVVYYDEGYLMHCAIYDRNGNVKSKWDLGNIYKHPIESVPKNYGEEVRFFRKV
ncbi:MAG: hypothetical protein Q7S33_03155 [Nanoarchaeota archaeon]|nr:hypothetical protein [Nanoarchaeota archaeon]